MSDFMFAKPNVAGAGTGYIASVASASAGQSLSFPSVNNAANISPAATARDIESAVYAHIQAIRALGRTRTDSWEIAKGLGISQKEVEKTIASLTKKGVRVISG